MVWGHRERTGGQSPSWPSLPSSSRTLPRTSLGLLLFQLAVVLFVGLLLVAPWLGSAARYRPFAEDCLFDVPPVPLPSELSGPAFLSHSRALNPDSLHMHSEFLVNFTRRSDNVFFSVAVPSVFRVTVSQDLTADIDLRLYARNDSLRPIAVRTP